MIQEPLTKIGVATAAEICANSQPSDAAKKLLREGMSPQEFVGALLEKKLHVDAIGFLAYGLPAREGVWWGCLCMQHVLGDKLTPAERAAATAAVGWVLDPTEENRAGAGSAAGAAPPPSIAGGLATAVFQTGGNIAPPGLPPRAPAPFAPARSIAMAVKLASVKTEPAKIAKTQSAFAELGVEIAAGRHL